MQDLACFLNSGVPGPRTVPGSGRGSVSIAQWIVLYNSCLFVWLLAQLENQGKKKKPQQSYLSWDFPGEPRVVGPTLECVCQLAAEKKLWQ